MENSSLCSRRGDHLSISHSGLPGSANGLLECLPKMRSGTRPLGCLRICKGFSFGRVGFISTFSTTSEMPW
jgi:hypothetical protein